MKTEEEVYKKLPFIWLGYSKLFPIPQINRNSLVLPYNLQGLNIGSQLTEHIANFFILIYVNINVKNSSTCFQVGTSLWYNLKSKWSLIYFSKFTSPDCEKKKKVSLWKWEHFCH